MKTVFFSEAIAACDLQIGRQLIELMKVHEYMKVIFTLFERHNNAKKKRNNVFQNAFVRLSKDIIMRNKKRNNAFQKA